MSKNEVETTINIETIENFEHLNDYDVDTKTIEKIENESKNNVNNNEANTPDIAKVTSNNESNLMSNRGMKKLTELSIYKGTKKQQDGKGN